MNIPHTDNGDLSPNANDANRAGVKFLMNNKDFYEISPCLCGAYYKQGTSNFLLYTNGHASIACMEVFYV